MVTKLEGTLVAGPLKKLFLRLPYNANNPVVSRQDSTSTFTIMVPILHGKIGAYVGSNPCYLICVLHLIRWKGDTTGFVSSRDLSFFMRAHHVLSYHLIQVPCRLLFSIHI